ncbi:hypothetical protein EI94DRAFT_1702174 [Lactarius quietus]|nr:hypothetical protein EI94DRAFT_1702174 [Lactarius quietus]
MIKDHDHVDRDYKAAREDAEPRESMGVYVVFLRYCISEHEPELGHAPHESIEDFRLAPKSMLANPAKRTWWQGDAAESTGRLLPRLSSEQQHLSMAQGVILSQQMLEPALGELPLAINNTNVVALRCNVAQDDLGGRLDNILLMAL